MSPILPVTGLFAFRAAQQMEFTAGRPRINFDISSGPFIPLEGEEEFDVGGTVDLKIQGEVLPRFFVGGEFAYAGHGKDAGNLYSEGMLHRFYFLVPIEGDIPLGGLPENPLSLRLGIAPGFVVVDPVVDQDLEDSLHYNGYDLDEETIVAFDLRVRIGLRIPLDPHVSFLVEGTFDWAEATGEAVLRDYQSGTEDRQRKTVELSGFSVMVGFATVF
jgi:hypothetical protein